MAFNNRIPFDALVEIYRLLTPRERLTCSEVCHEWLEAFSFSFFTKDFLLKIDSRNANDVQTILEDSRRDHHQFAVDLTDCQEVEVIQCLKEMAHRVRYLWLFGDAPPTVSCLQAIDFQSLTELSLEIHAGCWQEERTRALDVFMPNLETFRYLQMYGPHRQTVMFHLVAPNLKKATINLDVMRWEDPIIEVLDCSMLEELDIDLKGHIWDKFFALEPNLRFLELVNLQLDMMDSIGRNCPKIEWLTCDSFFVWTEAIRPGALRPLATPMLTHLTLRECDFRSFKLRAGTRLKVIDLECFEDHCEEIRSNFQSLANLKELTLHINQKASGMMNAFGRLENLRRLKIAFQTISNEDDCSRLIADICANCPLLERLSFHNTNVFQLNLSSECFLRLTGLKHLRDLDMVDVTVLEEERPMPDDGPMNNVLRIKE